MRNGTEANHTLPRFILKTISHHRADATTSPYEHLSEISVQSGDKVTGDQTIAKSGNTGCDTNPHLHYEELHKGKSHPPTFNPKSHRPASR
jgi:murein DD-endopeptidase MepM/ murein hydrolase activator NlpD